MARTRRCSLVCAPGTASYTSVVPIGGMKVVHDYDLDTCPPLDILIIPGGWGGMREMNHERLVNWIGTRSRQVDTVTSVCTGAYLPRFPFYGVGQNAVSVGKVF